MHEKINCEFNDTKISNINNNRIINNNNNSLIQEY